MSIAATTSQTATQQADTVLTEKVRWSLRQRLRRQLHLLGGDFFDELDDFLFSSGQKGQFADTSVYLQSMREIRAKQAHFEGLFLDGVIRRVKQSYNDNSHAGQVAGHSQAGSDGVFEKVEVDLALQAMARKADKLYLPLIKQVEAVQAKVRGTIRAEIIGSRVVLDAVVDTFAEVQTVFNVALDIRLVLIKMFEQHFALKLEKIFLDIISIANNINDPGFVEKLYSSSSAFRTRVSQSQRTVIQSRDSVGKQSGAGPAGKPDSVEAAVGQLITSLCEGKNLPAFVDSMIHNQWRAVMFLIGVNRGTVSVEWSEARHTANLLVTTVFNRLQLASVDHDSLLDQLSKGFALIQMPQREREEFFLDLDQYLSGDMGTDADEKTVLYAPAANAGQSLEASVSPSGEAILDQQDLDEIAKMLGDGEAPDEPRQLSDFLYEVDALGNQAVVDFMLAGAYSQCILRKSPGNPDLFTICKQGAQISVTRSRLGLALALQSGELRLAGEQVFRSAGERTMIESSSRTRH